LSDVLNEEPPFVVLTDVDSWEIPVDRSRSPEHHDTVILRKAEIVFALPHD
jgi:hypothetical protein